MKKFLLNTFILLIPIIVFFICLELTLRKIPNDYIYKETFLNDNAHKIKTLILGSSHSFYDINPIYLKKDAFNASHISQTLDYDYRIFLKFKNNLKNLSTIIIPISYFSLWEKLSNGKEKWRCKNYVLYYDIESNNFKENSEVLNNTLSKNISRATKYLLQEENEVSCSSLGWGTKYKSENSKDLIKAGKIAALRHRIDNIESKENNKIYLENIFYLNEIIKWSKTKNIQVILFTPPAFETYRNKLNSIQLNKTISTAKTIANKHHNCTYLNMLNDSTFIAEDYFDADHLSEIGAKKLTLKLNELIQ